jgi:ABC-2 type transport system ATP-binding protein
MPVIEVEKLHKRYGGTIAVDDVSFTVEKGEIFGILGPNGAGKTTTVECVMGLRVPDRGSVRVLGLDPRRDRSELTRRLGAQLQESAVQDKLRVGEAIELYASLYNSPPARPRVRDAPPPPGDRPGDGDELLDLLGLTGQRRTPYRKLSGGQKQRLSIALALIGNPEIAVLDELTTGLDPQARRDTWELIAGVRARGVTIVLVTHFMDEAQRLCDRLALIDAGRVVAVDTPGGLVARADGGARIRFTPSAPLAADVLTGLPGLTALAWDGAEVVVTGTGNVVTSVLTALTERRIVPVGLQVEQATLEDAFVALTGRRFDTATTDR